MNLNYSFIPQKVTKNIYDGTCIHCSSKNTYPIYNMLHCDFFNCNNCNKQFKSTKVIETRTYTR